MAADATIKHWLLNLAVEYPVSLGLLFPAVACEALNVKPVPGCHAEDYAGNLIDLSGSGMIALSSEVSGDDVNGKSGIAQIVDRFLKLANDDPALRHEGRLRPTHERNRLPGTQVSFNLTARGGEAWERMADPDWTRILTVSVDSRSGDLFSPDRHLLMAYMGWYQEIEGQRIEPEAITWQTHSDYEILYWKRLPRVHHASFSPQSPESSPEHRWSSGPQWFRDWYRSAITWHKQPWELTDWPSSREDRSG